MKRKVTRWFLYVVLGTAFVAAIGVLYVNRSDSRAETKIAVLAKETHFHGIAVDVADPTRLYLATHHGLYAVESDGKVQRISATRDDFMGFTPHPTDPSVLFASGHPAEGGNLGFITSQDRGRSWEKLSNGIHGPVDFHQMSVSKADSKVIYGVYGDLQRSSDGGQTWVRVGPAPVAIVALAASSNDANVVYAATQAGLLRSRDGGRNWQAAHDSSQPTTMVNITKDGNIYAFIVGIGLVRANEKNIAWQALSNGFGDDYVVHFAADPTDHYLRLYAVTFNSRTQTQSVIASRDGGTSWVRFGAE